MYHYVRQGREDLPYFRYLHIDDFKEQLDYLQKTYTLISKDDFLTAIKTNQPIDNAAILTFDDGLTDHIDVTNELLSRGLWGIFYLPTGCYTNNKLLNVHRIHMLLGKYGGPVILDALQNILTEDMVVDTDVTRFHDIIYNLQENDAATSQVKKIMNFSVRDDVKDSVLDQLMAQFFDNEAELTKSYYLNESQIKFMHDNGMLLGAHSVSHPVFSKLSYDKQKSEIIESFQYIENITGPLPVKTFCYPYGGDHVFNDDTLKILNAENCLFSFSVEQKDIDTNDLKNRPQSLPRYDCNQFPHGRASMGVTRPHMMKTA
jgi:peptidoglycan/xylan/chitin deacetylase (PgdA/CDA1 family)